MFCFFFSALEIIDINELNNLKKMLTLIDSEQSVFSESWEHINRYEKIVKKKEEDLLLKKVLEKKK